MKLNMKTRVHDGAFQSLRAASGVGRKCNLEQLNLFFVARDDGRCYLSVAERADHYEQGNIREPEVAGSPPIESAARGWRLSSLHSMAKMGAIPE